MCQSNAACKFAHDLLGEAGVPAPSPQPHAPAGFYRFLREGAADADPLIRAELETFLDTYTGRGCGREDCLNSPRGPVTRFEHQVVEGNSRHDAMLRVLLSALSEAMAGCYPAREALDQLHWAFRAAFTDKDDPVRLRHLDEEFARLAQWAAAHADPVRAHHDDIPQRRRMIVYSPQLALFARKRWRRVNR